MQTGLHESVSKQMGRNLVYRQQQTRNGYIIYCTVTHYLNPVHHMKECPQFLHNKDLQSTVKVDTHTDTVSSALCAVCSLCLPLVDCYTRNLIKIDTHTSTVFSRLNYGMYTCTYTHVFTTLCENYMGIKLCNPHKCPRPEMCIIKPYSLASISKYSLN